MTTRHELAVIGATWTVCRKSFPELIETGQVEILATVERMAKDPEKLRRKEEMKRARAERRAADADAVPTVGGSGNEGDVESGDGPG